MGELSPDWLTRALRAGGALREASVVAVRAESLGEGEGFMGGLARLELKLDAPEVGAPARLVAKLPTPLAAVREAGELLGVYDREVRFYSELAASIPLRTPRCYFAAMDPNPGERHEETVLRWLERAPAPLLPMLLRLGAFAARRSRRRYVLLLEDLAPARTGDQLAGCDAGQAERALRPLARLHAAFWERPRPWPHSWVRPADTAARLFHVAYRRARARGEKNRELEIPARLRGLAGWLDAHGVALLRSLAAPPVTLLHGDYRLDNLALPEGGSEPAVLDWQVPLLGRGVYDVAYFLVGSLPPEIPAAQEEALVRYWHEELLRLGVRGYGFDACLADYRRARLFMLYRVLAAADALALVHERAGLLWRVWLERLDARLADARPAELMRAAPPPHA
jgi:aminoglycoside phosphotransferase (APT) family kinase protein